MFKTMGRIEYDPIRTPTDDRNRAKEFRKGHKVRTCIVQLPYDGLDMYYRWLLERKYGTWMKLAPPMFGKHVTIVKGDELQKTLKSHERIEDRYPAWKKHTGKKIEVIYSNELKNTGPFWYLPVEKKNLLEIREELGLSCSYEFHITIGRMDDWQRRTLKCQK